MNGPRQCGDCHEPVIQAFTPRPLLLDYALAPKGAVAARIDPDRDVWIARYLALGEAIDPDAEVRFTQHTVTCTGPIPLVED